MTESQQFFQHKYLRKSRHSYRIRPMHAEVIRLGFPQSDAFVQRLCKMERNQNGVCRFSSYRKPDKKKNGKRKSIGSKSFLVTPLTFPFFPHKAVPAGCRTIVGQQHQQHRDISTGHTVICIRLDSPNSIMRHHKWRKVNN